MSSVTHISSLLVSAHPGQKAQVCSDILVHDFAEIAHADETGKIIVTLETADESAIVSALTEIQLINGVVNASLVYHQADNTDALETLATGVRHD
ncbi:MAG: chaperone NapD [Cognatishimia sp.]